MNQQIHTQLENVLNDQILQTQALSGGCIANSYRIDTAGQGSFFIKYGTNTLEAEAASLRELARPGVIHVPQVIYTESSLLILEYIPAGTKKKDFFSELGRKLARLHRYTSQSFGFYEDNYIGSTPQLNIATAEEATDWSTFYFNKRLLFQYKLAVQNGMATTRLKEGMEYLKTHISSLLAGSEEPPALLHGDLWAGNYMCNQEGNPVLIDPAVYYGHREADLAMTHLFGGFPPEFYQAYQAEYPLPQGWEQRQGLYKLYHVLNHLNMFGRGYLHEAEQLIAVYR
ncbi:MAG: fructosamine kinase family protein [Tannerellaceae bacterium]|nr:fructosamine kinase family protein [Tannerellaceae bacterium]